MLEVVDSQAESPKCVRTRNEQELEAPAQNTVNWTVHFSKPDGLVSLASATVRSTIGSDEGVLLPAKLRLTKGRDEIHYNSKSCGGG
jgi:hypothetical protein